MLHVELKAVEAHPDQVLQREKWPQYTRRADASTGLETPKKRKKLSVIVPEMAETFCAAQCTPIRPGTTLCVGSVDGTEKRSRGGTLRA